MYISRKLKGWKYKVFIVLLLVVLLLFQYKLFEQSEEGKGIAIVVITNNTNVDEYRIALDTVKCYAKIQEYTFKLVKDTGPEYPCLQNDFLFRRHCITANLLSSFEAVMFLDADIGVVNPKRRIEEFMEDDVYVTLYDRYQNWEVATGSYIVKNTQYARNFLNEFAQYESKLPTNSLHGSDNGAIHMFLAEKLLSPLIISSSKCESIYNNSKSFHDLFTFEACIRNLLDSNLSKSDKVKILKKGFGWVRDGWLTNNLWSHDVDFMLHGWKMSQLRKAPSWEFRPIPTSRNQWFNPFLNDFDVKKCTWNYNPRLIRKEEEIKESLLKMKEEVEVMKKKTLNAFN
ncbi:unnamed protein product [Caenorhabditis brenneri]